MLDALYLTGRNLANSNRIVKHVATVDAREYAISLYIHTCVGFCVARSDYSDNARASIRGTNYKDSHAFLYIVYYKLKIDLCGSE